MPSRVLIVEDDDILRDIYTVKFEMEGFAVDSAPDGLAGLARVAAQEPDLIILDMLMPKLGGLEFLRRFSADYGSVNIIVLVASNKSDQDLIREARSLGASDYLIKSQLTPDELVARAREHLAARKTD